MSTSRLLATVKKYRQQLLTEEAQAEHSLNSAYRRALDAIAPALEKLYDQMIEKMAGGEQIPLSWLYEAQRVEGIKKLIASEFTDYGAISQAETLRLQRMAVELGQEAAHALLQSTVPRGISYSFGVPSQHAIADLIGATQAGSPLADLFNGFGAEAAKNVADALIRGVTLGQNPRVVARDVQQALGVSRARALTISRNESVRCYRSAAISNYQANSDVVESMVRVADLSIRTCAACIALNGKVYGLDEDPGFHVCDRCALIPKTKDWSEILGPLGIDTSGIPDTRPQIQSGSDWFDEQPESTQRQILGNAKYNAWANGDFKLSDIVGHDHDADWGHSIYEKPLKDLVSA